MLAGCTRPPGRRLSHLPSAQPVPGGPAGKDAKGEDCIAQSGAALPADLPVTRTRDSIAAAGASRRHRVVQLRGPGDAARLDALAQGGLWRTWLDQRVTCAAPQATTLAGGIPARLLACTRRRNGGWPHVALVAAGPDGPVLADGAATATPVMERLATGQASAAGANQARSPRSRSHLRRMAAAAFSGNDVGRYEKELMKWLGIGFLF